MADLGFGDSGFDANAKENQRTNSVVPAGEYPMILVESEKKATIKGDGEMLKCKFQIVSGEFQNRIVFKNFSLWLPSEQAVQIAKGEFSELCRAVGVATPRDSSELHNKPVMGKVKIRVDKSGQYDDQNDISEFKPVGKPLPNAPTIAAASTTGEPW
jgi:hypothetical protein